MKKIERNKLTAHPIIINNHKIDGLRYINISTDDKKIKLLILEETKGNSLNQIAKTYEIFKNLFKSQTEEESIELALCIAFDEIKCTVCRDCFSALRFTQSFLGNICHWCFNKYKISNEWKPIEDLKKHIKKECLR